MTFDIKKWIMTTQQRDGSVWQRLLRCGTYGKSCEHLKENEDGELLRKTTSLAAVCLYVFGNPKLSP